MIRGNLLNGKNLDFQFPCKFEVIIKITCLWDTPRDRTPIPLQHFIKLMPQPKLFQMKLSFQPTPLLRKAKLPTSPILPSMATIFLRDSVLFPGEQMMSWEPLDRNTLTKPSSLFTIKTSTP